MPDQSADVDEQDEDLPEISRRKFVAGAAGVSVIGGATAGGYLYATGYWTSREEHAEVVVDAIAEDMPVEDWRLEGDEGDQTLHVWYQTSGSISTDHERVGMAYVDAVDDGLDVPLEATALGASNEYTFAIALELAEDYLDDEISREEYLDQIE